MRAVERVVGRPLVGRPQPLDHLRARARGLAAGDELRLQLGHRLAVLLADRLAQVVGLRAAEPGDVLGDLHRLLLVEDHALGGLEDRAQPVVGIGDQLGVMLAAGVRRDLVHRARPVQRVERHQVVELVRLDLLERLAHALGLELEHADRVAPGHHLVGGRVLERQRRHVGPLTGGALDDVERILDHVEVAEAEEVHLEQSDLLDRLHRELRHGPEHPLAVLVRAGVGDLERHDVGQRAIRDHDRGGVDRGVPHDSLEPLGHLDDLLGGRVPVDLGAQAAARPEAVLEARRTAHDRVGDQLGQAIAGAVVEAEHARRVARRRAREHLAERDDLRHRLLAVLVGHVPDHALTAADREVDVDIGHRHALGIQEALEQQAVAERVDVGDLRASTRPATRRPSRGPGRPRSPSPWRT